MQDRSRKLLTDIADAASFIIDLTNTLSAHDYEENRLIRQAVERNFEVTVHERATGQAGSPHHKWGPRC